MHILGVDIGGTGIKAAAVDTQSGELISEHKRIPTPQPATPENIAISLAQLVTELAWSGPIGCGFPATVHHGVAYSFELDTCCNRASTDVCITSAKGLGCTPI